jgi:hypothetical protein
MMSAAISMVADVEQTNVRPVSDDLFAGQSGREDVSFAKSLNESVGVSSSLQVKNTVDEAAIALPGMKATTKAVKTLQEVPVKIGVKGNAISAPEISAHSELKGEVADRIIQPQAATAAGSQEKISAGNTGTTKVEIPAQAEGTAEHGPPSSPILNGTPDAGATTENLEPHLTTGVGDRPSISTGDRPVMQKQNETPETVKGDAFTKKTAKAQESAVTPKTMPKSVGNAVNATAIEAKGVMGSSAESAILVAGQAAAPTVTLQAETGKTTDFLSNGFSTVTKHSTGVSLVPVAGQIRNEAPSGAKGSFTNTEMPVTAGGDPVASAVAGASVEKMAAVTVPGGSANEKKPQTAPESGGGSLHAMGVVPTSVVVGNATGEVAASKPLPGDAGAHAAVLPTMSREQDGSGVVAPSMDGAPRMLTATPTSLEVGIQNGTHGWLKVRAEMTDGGVVNASVSAASSAGQEMLHRELPGLTAYLQEEKVAVNTVVVHSASGAGADARNSSGTDGAGGQTPQRSNSGESQQESLRKTTSNGSEETMTYRTLHGVDDDGSLPLATFVNGGSWLSVRA